MDEGRSFGSVNNGAGKRHELLEGQQDLETGEGMAPEAPPPHSRLEGPRLGHVVPWVLATLEH